VRERILLGPRGQTTAVQTGTACDGGWARGGQPFGIRWHPLRDTDKSVLPVDALVHGPLKLRTKHGGDNSRSL
jgi:hypothetical protein